MSNRMSREDYFATWSSLHGNAEIKGIVRWWLSISYRIAIVLQAARVSPHAITIFGVVAAFFTWRTSPSWSAIGWLILSLICDGVDGTVAIVRARTSTWGAVVDATADRIAEVFWVGAFIALGTSLEVAFVIWLAAAAQEYVRARAGGLGLREVGVVTIAERPIRASALCIALAANAVGLSWAPVIALVLAVMQMISGVSVLRFAYQKFRSR